MPSSTSHQLLREPLLKFFLGGMFIVHQGIGFDFCYDLDLCSQGQAVRAFFIGMGFVIFAPWALAFYFSCDLDISAQGKTMTVVFIRMHFATVQKYNRDFVKKS